MDGVFAMRDGGDMEDGIRLGQGVTTGVVAERTLVAQRLLGIDIAFDDEVAVGETVFNSGKMFYARSSINRSPCSNRFSVVGHSGSQPMSCSTPAM